MNGILILRESYGGIGGIDFQALRIAEVFRKKRFLAPILITSRLHSPIFNLFASNGFPAYGIPMRRCDGGGINEAARRIEPLLQTHDIVALQAHTERESCVTRVLKKRFPHLANIFRVHTYINSGKVSNWRKRLYHGIDSLTSRYVDKYVCINSFVSKELVADARIDPGKMCIVRNICPNIGTPDNLSKEGPNPLDCRIAMVANLVPGKGHNVLVNSLAELKKRGIEIKVDLIGGPVEGESSGHRYDFPESLRRQIHYAGIEAQVTFRGFIRDMHEALHGIPIVVLPSDAEGSPNSILEAMQLRKIVIATSVGGIPEIIQDGVNGMLHAPGDSVGLANRLMRIFTTPAATWNPMREAGRTLWMKQYSEEVIGAQIIDIHKHILRDSPAPR